MNKEQIFLVRYGLHNFVSCKIQSGRSIFFFTRQESQNMICHAKDLIKETFGEIVLAQPV